MSSCVMSFCMYIIWPHTQYIELIAQILMYNSEEIFELRSSHDQDLMLNDGEIQR